jgi:hypothetical protein
LREAKGRANMQGVSGGESGGVKCSGRLKLGEAMWSAVAESRLLGRHHDAASTRSSFSFQSKTIVPVFEWSISWCFSARMLPKML